MRRGQKQGTAYSILTELRLRDPEVFRGLLACAYGAHLFIPPQADDIHQVCQRCNAAYVRPEALTAVLVGDTREA